MAAPIRATQATAYAYEDVKWALAHTAMATAYAYERVALVPQRSSLGVAMTYAYEKVLPVDPNQLHVWNPETNLYDRVPWYVFNLDTEQWQQIV